MANPDYKALCAELLEWAERTSGHYYKQADVILRARAALAQPEPVAPTDEKLLEIATQQWGSFHGSAQWPGAEHVVEVSRSDLVSFARAILAKWGPR